MMKNFVQERIHSQRTVICSNRQQLLYRIICNAGRLEGKAIPGRLREGYGGISEQNSTQNGQLAAQHQTDRQTFVSAKSSGFRRSHITGSSLELLPTLSLSTLDLILFMKDDFSRSEPLLVSLAVRCSCLTRPKHPLAQSAGIPYPGCLQKTHAIPEYSQGDPPRDDKKDGWGEGKFRSRKYDEKSCQRS